MFVTHDDVEDVVAAYTLAQVKDVGQRASVVVRTFDDPQKKEGNVR